ncbi:MAG: TonB-dependent receptor, partial [Bacteroidota bacterium]
RKKAAIKIVVIIAQGRHNFYGSFFTPRLHLRYALNERSVIRGSIGSGRRTARILAEQLGRLASARTFVGIGISGQDIREVNQEIAWNTGINFTHNTKWATRDLVLSFDAYHTRFEQQLVVDIDDARSVRFYNLDGKSISTSLQAQLDYELLQQLDVRLAYRFNDVQTDFIDGNNSVPLVAKHRAFVNLAYEIQDKWMLDATLNWRGRQRLPNTTAKAPLYQLETFAPDFFLLNGQITRNFGEQFSLYLGGENILNFRQPNPIIAANDPFGEEFDATIVWSSIFGRNLYAGLRWTIE